LALRSTEKVKQIEYESRSENIFSKVITHGNSIWRSLVGELETEEVEPKTQGLVLAANGVGEKLNGGKQQRYKVNNNNNQKQMKNNILSN
jgi:hypothetical protein